MLSFDQAMIILNRAKDAHDHIPVLITQLDEQTEAQQHLTALYGQERVSKSLGVYTCAAQKNLEYAEERKEKAGKRLLQAVEYINEASSLLKLIRDQYKAWCLLDMHYLSGWSITRIAKSYEVAPRTVSRWRDNALQALKDALDAQTEANP